MPNTPIVSVETPMISAGAETSKQPGVVQKSDAMRKEPLAFKKKLEDCIKVDETPYGVPTAVVNQNGGNNEDNSMAVNLTDTQAKSQIVGILEGFGLLDYQSDLPSVSPQNSQTAGEQAPGQAAGTLLQELMQNTEQTGALEKYARMLSKDQLSKLPIEMQQAIAKAVGDYLGSFESTNNEPAQKPVGQNAGVSPVTTQAAETAADTTALADKIASLLIKLKTVAQDAKPADTATGTVNIPAQEAAPVAQKPKMETAKPAEPAAANPADKLAEQQATVQPAPANAAQTKPVASQDTSAVETAKPEVKTPSLNEQTVQTHRTDGAVSLQLAATTDTDGVQQTAKAPEAKTSDFVKDNVMRIVDKMSSQVSDGKYDFDVELKPDFLGKVNIKLSMQNGEIRMQIKTDDVNVKGMFADQISSMQAALKDKGVTVTNIDVTYQSQMQTGADQRSFSQSGGGKKQSGRVHVSLEQITGTGVFETMSQMAGYAHGGSSVEYLA